MNNKSKDQARISLSQVVESARRYRDKVGAEAWAKLRQDAELKARAESNASYARLREFIESPESRARDHLQAELTSLKTRPEIAKSETCTEVLSAVIWCLEYNWGAQDAFALLRPIGREYRKEMAKAGGVAKKEADPVQNAKQQVRECWELWRHKPANYESKAAFARDMLLKFDDLKSQRVIERWCKKWESEPC